MLGFDHGRVVGICNHITIRMSFSSLCSLMVSYRCLSGHQRSGSYFLVFCRCTLPCESALRLSAQDSSGRRVVLRRCGRTRFRLYANHTPDDFISVQRPRRYWIWPLAIAQGLYSNSLEHAPVRCYAGHLGAFRDASNCHHDRSGGSRAAAFGHCARVGNAGQITTTTPRRSGGSSDGHTPVGTIGKSLGTDGAFTVRFGHSTTSNLSRHRHASPRSWRSPAGELGASNHITLRHRRSRDSSDVGCRPRQRNAKGRGSRVRWRFGAMAPTTRRSRASIASGMDVKGRVLGCTSAPGCARRTRTSTETAR